MHAIDVANVGHVGYYQACPTPTTIANSWPTLANTCSMYPYEKSHALFIDYYDVVELHSWHIHPRACAPRSLRV